MKYSYKARDTGGSEVLGSIESSSASAVSNILAETGLIVVSIEEFKDATPNSGLLDKLVSQKVKTDEVMLFTRQLSVLQRAGIPLRSSLAGLEEVTEKAKFREVLKDVRTSIESGKTFSTALSAHPGVFSAFYVKMIQIGEVSGSMVDILIKLYSYLNFEKDTKSQVKTALRYPTFVLTAIIIALVILNIFVIPVFAKVFISLNAPLPLMTKVLIGFSAFMVQYWLLIALATFGLFLWIKAFLATPAGQLAWGRLVLKLPIIGQIVLKSTLARFASGLSISLKAGVPLLQSLDVIRNTIENPILAIGIDSVRQSLAKGDSFEKSLRSAKVFSPLVVTMVKVGEETGELDEMLSEVSSYYELEIKQSVSALSSAVEPIMLVFLGGILLVLALGIFMPMWDLGSAAASSNAPAAPTRTFDFQ